MDTDSRGAISGAIRLIRVTRINHVPLVLNSDLIEHVEVTPDTVVSLTNGQKFMVLETLDEVISRVIDFRRSITSFPELTSNRCERH